MNGKRGAWLASIGVRFTGAAPRLSASPGPELPSTEWLGASHTIPLPFSRIFYKNELETAEATKRQTDSQLQAVRAKADSELRPALARFDAAAERVNLYDSGTLADVDAALEKTLHNYQRAGASLGDYIIARGTASDVHLAHFDALNDRAHALATVEEASGLCDLVKF